MHTTACQFDEGHECTCKKEPTTMNNQGKLSAVNLVCNKIVCPQCFDKNIDRHTGIFTSKECQSEKHNKLIGINLLGKRKENPEYIGLCVDSHEAMVEALKVARIALNPHVFIDDNAKKAINRANEALKQAGEL